MRRGEEDYQKEMFWGSYRPGIYFGMKTRSEVPISTGIMWSSGKGAWLRHTCRHEDSLRRYGWTRHNGRDFGQHEAIDELLNANMVASFVKEAPRHSSGGSWATRLRVRPLQTPTELFSAMYYIILPSACRVAPIKSKKKVSSSSMRRLLSDSNILTSFGSSFLLNRDSMT